jgi:hypothetical protein
MEWIESKYRLPDDNQKVIFYTSNKETRLGIFLKKDQWDRENMFVGDGFHFCVNVSHWMPIPNAPIN